MPRSWAAVFVWLVGGAAACSLITPLDFVGDGGAGSGDAVAGTSTEGGTVGESGASDGAVGGTVVGRGGGAGVPQGGNAGTSDGAGEAGTGDASGAGGASGDSGASGGGRAGAGAGAGGAGGDSGNGGSSGSQGGSSSGASGAGMGGSSGSGAGDAGSSCTSGSSSGSGGGPASCTEIDATAAKAFGGHCYLLMSSATTWPDARDACPARFAGGHLVTITSDAEQSFVWQSIANGDTDVWIGAWDGLMDAQPPDSSTVFFWITGEDMCRYQDWAAGQPNHIQKTCNGSDCWEHCAFLQSSEGFWNDNLCSFVKPSVCEWDTGG